jgi:hypothetical protein
MTIGEVLKKIPIYIIKNPIKTKLNANVRILLILLEYFAAIIPTSQNKYSTNVRDFAENIQWCLK